MTSQQPRAGGAPVAGPFTATEDEAAAVAEGLFGDQFLVVKRYVDILTSRGIAWGLLGPREPDRIWSRHVLNCVALSEVVPDGALVMDIGSGAGLPGLVLAILRPDLESVLVESLQRRATFLDLAVDELGLGERVTVVRGRAEDQTRSVDLITCRAVAPLDKLLRWTARPLKDGATLVALKGDRAHAEVSECRADLARRGLSAEVRTVRAHQRSEPTQVVVVTRVEA